MHTLCHNMRERQVIWKVCLKTLMLADFNKKEEKATNSTTAIINSDRCVTRTC